MDYLSRLFETLTNTAGLYGALAIVGLAFAVFIYWIMSAR